MEYVNAIEKPLTGYKQVGLEKALSYDLLGGVWEDVDAVKPGMDADMMIL